MQFSSVVNATFIVHYDGIAGLIEDLLAGGVQLIEHWLIVDLKRHLHFILVIWPMNHTRSVHTNSLTWQIHHIGGLPDQVRIVKLEGITLILLNKNVWGVAHDIVHLISLLFIITLLYPELCLCLLLYFLKGTFKGWQLWVEHWRGCIVGWMLRE